MFFFNNKKKPEYFTFSKKDIREYEKKYAYKTLNYNHRESLLIAPEKYLSLLKSKKNKKDNKKLTIIIEN